MTTIAAWPGRAEAWLDERGKGAWIVATVLGFIVFWPLGLFLLGYMIWSRRMFSHRCGMGRHNAHHDMARGWRHRHGFRSSGNTAFDAYKADTLDRLEREQEAFEAFLHRLRESKDKAEFDQYMEERARAARKGGTQAEAGPAGDGESGTDDRGASRY